MGVPLLAKVSTATKFGEFAVPGHTIPPGFEAVGPPQGAAAISPPLGAVPVASVATIGRPAMLDPKFRIVRLPAWVTETPPDWVAIEPVPVTSANLVIVSVD